MMKKCILLLLLPLLASCTGEEPSISSTETTNPLPPSVETEKPSETTPETNPNEFKLTQEFLSTLAGDFYLSGNATFTHEDSTYQKEDYTSTLSVNFNEMSYHSNELLSTGSQYSSKIIRRNNLPYTYYVNSKNEIAYTRVEDSGKSYTWDDFINPFTFLTVENFKTTSIPNQYMLSNTKLINRVCRLITGYSFNFTVFKITVEDNVLTKIDMKCEGKDSYLYPMNINFVYDTFAFDKKNPEPQVYERSIYHDSLDLAFENTLKENFTVVHTDHHDKYGDTIYRYYFTKEAIYCDREESGETTPFGYVQLEDGLYKFTNSKKDGLVKEYKISGKTIQDYYPDFKGFNSTIIQAKSETSFASYDNDNASIIARYLVESSEELVTAQASQTLDVTLKDNRLDTVNYFYSILGGFTYGDVTMQYQDYGNTKIDLDFSTMKNRQDIPE